MRTAVGTEEEETAALRERVALSMRTIADQQQVIMGLQALVEALKARLQALEAAPPAASPSAAHTADLSTSATLVKAQEEAARLRVQNGRLMRTVATLQSQRDEFAREVRTITERVTSLDETVQSQNTALMNYAEKDAAWQKVQSLHQLTEAQRQQAAWDVTLLRDDLHFERQAKNKWRALACALVERVDANLQRQLEQRFFTLREEERRYLQQRDAHVHQAPFPPRRSLAAPTVDRRPAGGPPHHPTPSPTALPVWNRKAASATPASSTVAPREKPRTGSALQVSSRTQENGCGSVADVLPSLQGRSPSRSLLSPQR